MVIFVASTLDWAKRTSVECVSSLPQEVIMPAAKINHDCLFKWLLKEFMPSFLPITFPRPR